MKRSLLSLAVIGAALLSSCAHAQSYDGFNAQQERAARERRVIFACGRSADLYRATLNMKANGVPISKAQAINEDVIVNMGGNDYNVKFQRKIVAKVYADRPAQSDREVTIMRGQYFNDCVNANLK